MQKYYFAIISSVATRLILDKKGLHKMFKVGYKKKSTSGMSYDEWYEYLEHTHYFVQEVRGRYYDTDRYKNENISYYDLPYCQLDTYF